MVCRWACRAGAGQVRVPRDQALGNRDLGLEVRLPDARGRLGVLEAAREPLGVGSDVHARGARALEIPWNGNAVGRFAGRSILATGAHRLSGPAVDAAALGGRAVLRRSVRSDEHGRGVALEEGVERRVHLEPEIHVGRARDLDRSRVPYQDVDDALGREDRFVRMDDTDAVFEKPDVTRFEINEGVDDAAAPAFSEVFRDLWEFPGTDARQSRPGEEHLPPGPGLGADVRKVLRDIFGRRGFVHLERIRPRRALDGIDGNDDVIARHGFEIFLDGRDRARKIVHVFRKGPARRARHGRVHDGERRLRARTENRCQILRGRGEENGVHFAALVASVGR